MKSVIWKSVVIGLLLSLPVSADQHEQADPAQAALQALAEGEHRSAAHKARNQYRHPVETLTWFGLRPDMTVVEIWPGSAGWYLEILAPFLKDQGTYYAAGPDADSSVDYVQRSVKALGDKLAANAELYGGVTTTELAPPAVDEVAEDVRLRVRHVRVAGADLDAGHEAQTGALRLRERLGDALRRVVVGERGDVDALAFEETHQLCRREPPVGEVRVHVEVDLHCGGRGALRARRCGRRARRSWRARSGRRFRCRAS